VSAPLLEARGISAGYGAGLVLRDVSLAIQPGEAVGLMGRNGMGKTTLIRALMGLLPLAAGAVHADGAEISAEAPQQRARRGIAVVPEGRGVFASLTVRENLLLAARPDAQGATPWPLERVLASFPRLGQRMGHRGGQLSGGEQQMLAIGRALMTSPRLLILDEATEGLAPLIRDGIWQTIREIRATGISGRSRTMARTTSSSVSGIARESSCGPSGARISVRAAPAGSLRCQPASWPPVRRRNVIQFTARS
jgi:branched-chain amino acid transport system ATP-binding protein